MSLEKLEQIARREITDQRWGWLYLGGFAIAIAIVLAALFTM